MIVPSKNKEREAATIQLHSTVLLRVLFLIKYGTTTLLRLPFFLGIFLAVLPVVGICNNCQRRTSFDPAADFQGAQIYLVFLLIILFLKKLMIFFS
jgi:hypothetical protein